MGDGRESEARARHFAIVGCDITKGAKIMVTPAYPIVRAVFDKEGRPQGFYPEPIWTADKVPPDAIEIPYIAYLAACRSYFGDVGREVVGACIAASKRVSG